MKFQIYTGLIIALGGLLLWAICSDAKAKAAGVELGRAALWAGLFGFCLAFSTHVTNC